MDTYRIIVWFNGNVVFNRANIPADRIIGVMHELSRDYKGANISAVLENN